MSDHSELHVTLASRLDRLFDEIRPDGPRSKPYTNDEVAASIKKTDAEVRVSGAYLSALRTGTKTNPSPKLLVALARHFGVTSNYFFDESAAEQADAEIALAKVVSHRGVRQLALRALDLTPQGLAAVASMIEHVLSTATPEDTDPTT